LITQRQFNVFLQVENLHHTKPNDFACFSRVKCKLFSIAMYKPNLPRFHCIDRRNKTAFGRAWTGLGMTFCDRREMGVGQTLAFVSSKTKACARRRPTKELEQRECPALPMPARFRFLFKLFVAVNSAKN
jgi:hypothetical protein